ncbi:alpha-L-fucosidase [Paenibacillus sp. GCM10023248]|uniref:alpha-L-fucosidase n=1 Tax=unclassified Paenibacillus TaxID=185978 RepID=UPI00237959F4|nr:alpha-L-fucosidase [Paenibacillus sp. MAHUQ-63]MDD9267298.1 alpha-L-fucosidase [Paenibacillus sp. MAHUQ-63]
MSTSIVQAREERTRWFRDARFGMFIHWGLYAIPARGEWVRGIERMSAEQYTAYFDEFDPADYDPVSWAKAAKQAGMKYAVLTAKHHDGFCLFDSQLTNFTSVHTRAGRDLVKEFVEAFRAEGLRVGLYYSLIDWHHEDYPAYGDAYHPMRDNEAFQRTDEQFERYLEYMHGQVRELLTGYGKLDIMWFDFSYGDMSGEKWRATELVRMIRELQPHIVIDNRLERNNEHQSSIYTEHPAEFSGDFASPEQIIPPSGVTDNQGAPIPWEACITLNNNWGYAPADRAHKSAKTVIRKLVECVSKNGNLLLNIGPDAKGRIPQWSLDVLEQVGDWLRLNGDSIYGCGQAKRSKPDWGRYTQKGNKLYAHLFEQEIGAILLQNLEGKIKHARLLADGSELVLSRPWNAAMFPDDAFVNFASPTVFTYALPDERDTVLELELIEETDQPAG